MKGGKQAGSKGRREGGKGRAGFVAEKVGGGAHGLAIVYASVASALEAEGFREQPLGSRSISVGFKVCTVKIGNFYILEKNSRV